MALLILFMLIVRVHFVPSYLKIEIQNSLSKCEFLNLLFDEVLIVQGVPALRL